MKKECILYKKLDNWKVMCTACAHMCQIEPWEYWECWIRKNIDWKLYLMVRGKALWVNVDPIEKKPLFHFHPWNIYFLGELLDVIFIVCIVKIGRCHKLNE